MNDAKDARLEQMMDAYGTAVLNLCAMLLRDAHLAQDASQDTFVKAYKSLDGFRGDGETSERAWLMRIAVNTCRDYRRSAWWRLTRRREPLEELADVAAQTSEEERGVLAQVQRLPAKLREAVLLCYVEEMTAQEAAQALGIRRSSVYRRLDRAKRLLRISLEGGVEHE